MKDIGEMAPGPEGFTLWVGSGNTWREKKPVLSNARKEREGSGKEGGVSKEPGWPQWIE